MSRGKNNKESMIEADDGSYPEKKGEATTGSKMVEEQS